MLVLNPPRRMVLVLVIDRVFSITIEHDYEQEHEHEHEHEKARENFDKGSDRLEHRNFKLR